jgi:hypothetical protein
MASAARPPITVASSQTRTGWDFHAATSAVAVNAVLRSASGSAGLPRVRTAAMRNAAARQAAWTRRGASPADGGHQGAGKREIDGAGERPGHGQPDDRACGVGWCEPCCGGLGDVIKAQRPGDSAAGRVADGEPSEAGLRRGGEQVACPGGLRGQEQGPGPAAVQETAGGRRAEAGEQQDRTEYSAQGRLGPAGTSPDRVDQRRVGVIAGAVYHHGDEGERACRRPRRPG